MVVFLKEFSKAEEIALREQAREVIALQSLLINDALTRINVLKNFRGKKSRKHSKSAFIRQLNRSFLFNIACTIAVYLFTTPSFANNLLVTAESKSSVTQISRSPHDNSSRSEGPPKPSRRKDQGTPRRLQLGVFPSRAEVEKIVVRLRKLNFKTWIFPVKNGYAVGAGAFSSQSNLDQAVKRLATAGLTDKVRVVEVSEKLSNQTVATTKTRTALSTLFDAKASQARDNRVGDESVPKKKYEKLEREVEVLKAQMQSLLMQRAAPQQGSNSTDEPATQAQAEASDTDIAETSSEQPADSSTGDDDAHTNEDPSVAEGSRQEEAEDVQRQLDTFLRRQKVLFKRGQLELEFGLTYAQDTTVSTCLTPEQDRVFCPSGSERVPRRSTRSVDTSLSLSYGIADDLALSLTLPYGYNEFEADFTPFADDTAPQVNHNDHFGVGDVGGSLRYTAWHEKGSIPGITLNLNAKSTTGDDRKRLGTGFWNVGGGISLVKTIDPVVFFGSVGYTAALEEARIDPGDQVSYSFGGGFSLNDRVSVSTSVSGSAVLRTEVNGSEIPGSAQDINSLQFSSTIKLSKALFVEPFVAFGLTKEAGDFAVGINVPYRFERRFPLPFFHN